MSGESFGTITKKTINGLGTLDGVWYFMKLSPLPESEEERTNVINAVKNNKSVLIDDDFVVKSISKCNEPLLSKKIRKAISTLEKKEYTIAIRVPKIKNFRTGDLDLNGQPVAYVVNERITLGEFPNHPHLYVSDLTKQFASSICYTDNPNALGDSIEERMVSAFEQVALWLVRHMFWEKYYELFSESYWIGPQANSFDDKTYIHSLNPNGLCRCGSRKKYSECCLPEHFRNVFHKPIDKLGLKQVIENWNKIEKFENEFFKKLQKTTV